MYETLTINSPYANLIYPLSWRNVCQNESGDCGFLESVMPPNNSAKSVWVDVVEHALRDIKDRFANFLGEAYKNSSDFLQIEEGYDRDSHADTHTLRWYKESGWLFWKKYVPRNVLRVIDIAQPDYWGSRFDENRIIPYEGNEPLKCELFLTEPRLRDFVQHVLEPLAKRLGYNRIEYIDMSNDPSAFYPGESPGLLKAQLLLKKGV